MLPIILLLNLANKPTNKLISEKLMMRKSSVLHRKPNNEYLR